MKSYLIIPVRYDSKRFPGKALALINDLPMVVITYRAVEKAFGFDRVIVLTDSEKIHLECIGYGIDCVYQDVEAANGTERIAYYALNSLDDDDLVVNVQGDEPLMTADIPQRLLFNLSMKPGFVWTAVKKLDSPADMMSQDVVKCSLEKGFISEFSRPYKSGLNWVHIGVYGYQVKRLHEYLEKKDTDYTLEQLRWGEPLAGITVEYTGFGVDRPIDILRVQERFMK